jgi:hypothetical protein
MTTSHTEAQQVEEPLAQLERQLINAYLAGAGEEISALLARDDAEARHLLAEASRYASVKLSEVEARSHFVRALHGEA